MRIDDLAPLDDVGVRAFGRDDAHDVVRAHPAETAQEGVTMAGERAVPGCPGPGRRADMTDGASQRLRIGALGDDGVDAESRDLEFAKHVRVGRAGAVGGPRPIRGHGGRRGTLLFRRA
jgi:hypothetical protein